jgi:hypothetical protein
LSNESTVIARPRRRELDFLRGIALIVMTTGHPMRTDFQAVSVDIVRWHYHVYGELFSALFMFMSAINVQNFIESAKRTPELDTTRFYLKSSLALFLMGTTYNLVVGTLPVIDIIQSIAIGTLFAYFLLQYRVPAWGLAIITAALFAAGLVIVGPTPYTDETIARVGHLKYLVAHFGPIPWLGFFSLGLLIDRIPRGRAELIAIPIFIAIFVASHFLPAVEGHKKAIMLYKANPRYLAMCIGFMPAIYLACRRWYRGGGAVTRVIETWGLESLVFLVFHWSFVFLLRPVQLAITHFVSEDFSAWVIGGTTLLLMAITLKPIVERRNRWSRHPDFAKISWKALIGSLAGWAVFMGLAMLAKGRGLTPVALLARSLSIICAFGASYAFCFLYPAVRAHYRRTTLREAPAA